MKKKIGILSIFLLILLLGCCGSAFAWQYEVTTTDVNEIARRFYNNTTFANKCIQAFNKVAEYNCDTYIMTMYSYNGYYQLAIYGINKSQITLVRNGTNPNNISITFKGNCYYCNGPSSGSVPAVVTYTDRTNLALGSGGQYRTAYLFYNNDLSETYTGPYENVEVLGPFEEPAPPLYFYPEATDQHANVYVFENVPLYTKSNNENLLIGMLTVPNETTITNVLVERFYWNGQNYVPKVLSQDINNNYITYDLYQTDNKQKAYNIYFNRNSLYDNNIYLIEWKDITKEPYEWTQAVFYIKNNKTTIINGEISPIVTFSGDTNIGDNNIIDNQNDNNDFWKNIYNEMFTLDSGEATQMLDNFITNTNLGEIGTLSGELMALNLLNGEPSDFVISWNNVVIPNLKNNEPKLLIPAGKINFSKLSVTIGNEIYQSPKAQDVVDVIGYVRIILGYTIIVLLIANIWETLMHVLGVGTAIYEDNTDEKAELYNVDLDTGTVNYTKMHKIPSKKQTWFYHRKG